MRSSILITKHRGGFGMLGGYFSAPGSPELHKKDGLWGLMTDFPLSLTYVKTE